MKNKHIFLSYLFATGVGDGLFFIGVGKLLSKQLQFFLGVSLLFIINEVSKLLFQFIFSTLDRKFSLRKALIFSEVFQSIFLLGIVIFSFDIFSLQILIASLIVLNFFDGLSKVAEFNLILQIFEPDERKKYNSFITTTNQSSRILGFVIGGVIINYDFYQLLFILNAVSFLISAIFALNIKIVDRELEVKSSWKDLLKKENIHIVFYTFLIATNTVILSSNSILGFELSINNTRETIIYQISNAIGSSIAAFIIGYKVFNIEKKENLFVLAGMLLQGILFLGFKINISYFKVLIFILISSISFFNLSIYITKLQDYADLKFGSKVYSLRQLNRSIFNAAGVFLLTTVSKLFEVNYIYSISLFCVIMVGVNYYAIKKGIISYISNK